MLSPTVTYIESDFAHDNETAVEYRRRVVQPRRFFRMRRLLALA